MRPAGRTEPGPGRLPDDAVSPGETRGPLGGKWQNHHMTLPVPPPGESRQLLQTIWDLAVVDRDWPTFAHLDSRWAAGHDTNAADVLRDLPEGLACGFDRHMSPQDSTVISLTVAGAACQAYAAQETLSIFLDFLRVATDVQNGCCPPADNRDAKPSLTDTEYPGIPQALPGSKMADAKPSLTDTEYVRHARGLPAAGRRDLLLLLFLLLRNETSVWSSLHGPDIEGHWQVTFDRRIRAFRGVTDLDDYWTRRHKPWETRPEPPAPASQEATGGDEARRALLSASPGVLADALLEWIHTATGGSLTQIAACAQFQPGLAPSIIEDALRRLQSQGLILLQWVEPAPALPHAMLTEPGAAHAERSRERWNDRVFRDRAARNALLAWIHDQGETPQGSVLIANFLRDPRSAVDGHFFSPANLDAAAAYLCEKKLIHSTAFIDKQRGPIRARLTAEGIDCAEQGANVAEYLTPTPKFLTPISEARPTSATSTSQPSPDAPIFIVHGSDTLRAESVARTVMAATGRQTTILREQASLGQTLIEKFEQHAAKASYAIIVLTPDDEGGRKGQRSHNPRGRQNVILEMGYFYGILGRSRVSILLYPGVEKPSDMDGIVYINFDDHGAWKTELYRELTHAHIHIDMSRV